LNHEVFGPVAPVVTFDTDEEAVTLANSTDYGLISYIYSEDLKRALRMAEAIESGMVAINRGVISDPAAPFGGVKQSGLGREGGFDGIHEFLETKYIGVEI
jgi:succinate-semialdehyde dehydrogenase/glutarate-semialdehyde dehydrogenase